MRNRINCRKKPVRKTVAWVVLFLLAVPGVGSARESLSPSLQATAEMQAKLLKSVQPGMTLAQIRRLLPSGTICSNAPEWQGGDSHLGNNFYLHGIISGSLSFLDRKREISTGQKYHSTDPINDLRLVTLVSAASRRNGHLYAQCLGKILGKPRDEKWDKEQRQWWVVWDFSHKCFVTYTLDTHEDTQSWPAGLGLTWDCSDSIPGGE